MKNSFLFKFICRFLIVSLFGSGFTINSSSATIIQNDQLVSQIQLDQKRQALSDSLLRDDVKERLLNLGVDPSDVQTRIGALTDSEVNSLQAKVDSMPAGSGALGTVVLVLLIFILLDVAGVTDIFPGV